jgi:hypothetical protein
MAGIKGERICLFVERVEHLDEENEAKKEVLAGAKGEGFDVKVLKEIRASASRTRMSVTSTNQYLISTSELWTVPELRKQRRRKTHLKMARKRDRHVARTSKRRYSSLRARSPHRTGAHRRGRPLSVFHGPKDDVRELRDHSKARTPVPRVAKAMRRTEDAVRHKAKSIDIGRGHRR